MVYLGDAGARCRRVPAGTAAVRGRGLPPAESSVLHYSGVSVAIVDKATARSSKALPMVVNFVVRLTKNRVVTFVY